MIRWLPALLLVGCGKSVDGWWDLTTWRIERDGDELRRDDAGFLLWQDAAYAEFRMVLSYTYDPESFDLVPVAEPTVSDWLGESTDDEVDFVFHVDDGGAGLQVGMTITKHSNARVTLETPEPLLDGSVWTWELAR